MERIARALRPPLAAALLAMAPGAAGAQPPADLESRVDAYLAPYLETGNFSGAVLLATRHKLLLVKGYGLADREQEVPVTPDTVFQIASVSKPFTAAAILLLEEEGRLASGDKLASFLPGYPRGEEITVHQLLTHSSGIPNLNSLEVYDELSLRAQTPESLVAVFRDLPLLFAPGERFSYSNSNYALLALLIERLSGRSYGAFLEERIFAPLEMRHSGHRGDPLRVIPHLAEGYSPAGLGEERAPWLDWSVKTGNGSLYSTVGDLLRFERGIHSGKLLSPASRTKMFTEHLESVGYGWFVRRRHDRPQFHMNGRSPGFTSYLGTYPEDGLTVIVLGNIYNSVATPIGADLAAMVLGREYEAPSFSRRRLSEQAAQRFAGRYRFGEDFYLPNGVIEIEAEDGFLFDRGHWLIPRSETGFLHRRYWLSLEFTDPGPEGYRRLRFDDFEGAREPAETETEPAETP